MGALSRHSPSDTTSSSGSVSASPTSLFAHTQGLRTSGWVHDKVSACASDLLLEWLAAHTHVVSPTRDCGESARGFGRSLYPVTTSLDDCRQW